MENRYLGDCCLVIAYYKIFEAEIAETRVEDDRNIFIEVINEQGVDVKPRMWNKIRSRKTRRNKKLN